MSVLFIMIEINNEYVSKCLLRCLKQAESNYGKALVQTDGLNKYSMLLMWTTLAACLDEIKRKGVSWTLKKKLAQKRSRAGRCAGLERESWTSFASVVSQRRSYGHCLCDSVLHSSWDSNCVLRWSLRNAGRTLP